MITTLAQYLDPRLDRLARATGCPRPDRHDADAVSIGAVRWFRKGRHRLAGYVAVLLLASTAVCGEAIGDGTLAESLPTDCDNSGVVNLLDFALFDVFFDGPIQGSAGGCRCFDVDGSRSVDLRDFAAMQLAFGMSLASPEPAPSNLFALQLADYHSRCAAEDGGDRRCHIGDACCRVQIGAHSAPCTLLEDLWVQTCDVNADGTRDRLADLDTLGEWNDFLWEPDDTCNLLAREHYPPTPTDDFYTRHVIPMCMDGSTPSKGTTVCPDGQPIIQCTDGTRPVFYYDAGTTDRWIIKVQNGGIACLGDCWEDEDRVSYSSAWGQNRAARTFTGLYKPFESSPFSSYNRIIIDKCVGDRNCGSNTLSLTDQFDDQGTSKGQAEIYFHGQRELRALLKHLTEWDEGNRLTSNSQIAIAAHSNGSNGMYMYIDRLAEYIRHDPSDGQPGLGLTGADVRGLASAFVRPSVEAENLINYPAQHIFQWSDYQTSAFDGHITAPLSTVGPGAADGLWYSSLVYFDGIEFKWSRNWGALLFDSDVGYSVDDIAGVATLDESCFREHGFYGGGGSNVEACLDSMHVLMNHVTTPMFLSPQLHDHVVRDGDLLSFTKLTDSFLDLGYSPDPGSLCGSHDENFACAESSECPAGVEPCDVRTSLSADYQPADLAVRVRVVVQGAVDRSGGTPEESPADVQAPVGHAVFAPEWNTHDSWEKPEKMDYQICDDLAGGECAWQSAPLWAALKSWLELDATVICVERDVPGIDPNRPLTSWSETTPGPLLDDRCGIPGN